MKNVSAYLKNNWIFLILIIFSCLRLPYFLRDAYVTDELWFLAYMNANKNFADILNIENYLGYGAGFWKLGAVVFAIFDYDNAPLVLRLLSFLSLLFSAVILYKIGKDNNNKYISLVTLLWLSTPLSWWSGKLVSPEYYSLAPLMLSAYLLFGDLSKRNHFIQYIAWIIAGFMIGIKLTAIPFVFFLVLLKLYKNFFNIKHLLKKILLIAMCIIIGFLLCNPNFLYNYNGFTAHITKSINTDFSSKFELLFHYIRIFSSNAVTWDMVPINGINEDVIPLASLLIILCFLLKKDLSKFVLISYLVLMVMLSANKFFYSWHVFQSAMIPFVAMALQKDSDFISTSYDYYKILLLLIIGFNILITVPNVLGDLKRDHLYNQYRKPWSEGGKIKRCLHDNDYDGECLLNFYK